MKSTVLFSEIDNKSGMLSVDMFGSIYSIYGRDRKYRSLYYSGNTSVRQCQHISQNNVTK